MGINGYRDSNSHPTPLSSNIRLHRRGQTDPPGKPRKRLPGDVGAFGLSDPHPLGQVELIHSFLLIRRGRGNIATGRSVLIVRSPSPTTPHGDVQDCSSIPRTVRASQALLAPGASPRASGCFRSTFQSLNLLGHLLYQRAQVLVGQMSGKFWIAGWVPRQVPGKKTADRQTSAGVIRLQSEFDPNTRSEKPVHFEKLDGAYGAVATGLRLGDSQADSPWRDSTQVNLASAFKSVRTQPGPPWSECDLACIRVRTERDGLGVYTLDQLATCLQARFRCLHSVAVRPMAPCRPRKTAGRPHNEHSDYRSPSSVRLDQGASPRQSDR